MFFLRPFDHLLPNSEYAKIIASNDFKLNSFDISRINSYNKPSQFKVDVLSYDMSFDLYPKDKLLAADVTIKAKFKNERIAEVKFNFYDNFEIIDFEIDGSPAEYILEDDILSFSTNPNFNDTFSVRINYKGTPKEAGLGSFSFDRLADSSLAVHTLNQPIYASTWFPCNDMPSDKALADIKITNDTGMISVSNGNLISESTEGSRKTYHWRTVYPISTYLIAIYSADYSYFEDQYISITGDTLPLTFYAYDYNLDNAKVDYSGHKEYLRVFEELFGPYPFLDEKYGVAEFGWEMGAMEHQTITGMASRLIGGSGMFKDIYIHELAHQWWGNAVGPETWNDIWLNEGFATYSEALYYERVSGPRALRSTMLSKFDEFGGGKLSDPGAFLFNRIIYNKGAWVLHMLRGEIGDENFFEFLRTYYEQFAYSNASTEDLKSVAEKISGKDLTKFFDQWVYKGIGIIDAEYSWKSKISEADLTEISIELKQVQDGYPVYNFPLDIKISGDMPGLNNNLIFYITTQDTVLKILTEFKPLKIELDPSNRLLAKFRDQNR